MSNNTLLSEHDIRPFSKSLEPTGKWHTYYPQSSFCFNKMSTWKIDLHFSNPSPPTHSTLCWNKWCLIDHMYTKCISGLSGLIEKCIKKNDECKYLKWWRKYGVLHLASCQLTLRRKEARNWVLKKTNSTIWQGCWVSLFLTAIFPLTKRLKIHAALPPLLFHSLQSQFADLISPSKYIYVLIHCSVHPTFIPFVAHSSSSTHPKL